MATILRFERAKASAEILLREMFPLGSEWVERGTTRVVVDCYVNDHPSQVGVREAGKPGGKAWCADVEDLEPAPGKVPA